VQQYTCAECGVVREGKAYGAVGVVGVYCSSAHLDKAISRSLPLVPTYINLSTVCDEDLVGALTQRVYAEEAVDAVYHRAYRLTAEIMKALKTVYPKNQIAAVVRLIAQELRR
jgi:hypothetical protein